MASSAVDTQSKVLQTTTSARLRNLLASYGRDETVISHLAALASCLERPFPKVVQTMYLETVSALTDAQLITALERAQREESKFFPSPARLLELAGVETQDQCSEREAREALAWVLQRVRKHGVDGHAARGELLRKEGRDEQGVWRPAVYEEIPAPLVPDRVRDVLEEFGGGDLMAGVKLVAGHPLLERDQDAYPSLGLKLVAMEKLEARWIAAWRKAAK